MKKALSLIGIITLFFGNIQAQNWNEIIKVVASDRGASDWFGTSVAISGAYAIVGAQGEDEDVAGLNTMSVSGLDVFPAKPCWSPATVFTKPRPT